MNATLSSNSRLSFLRRLFGRASVLSAEEIAMAIVGVALVILAALILPAESPNTGRFWFFISAGIFGFGATSAQVGTMMKRNDVMIFGAVLVIIAMSAIALITSGIRHGFIQ